MYFQHIQMVRTCRNVRTKLKKPKRQMEGEILLSAELIFCNIFSAFVLSVSGEL